MSLSVISPCRLLNFINELHCKNYITPISNIYKYNNKLSSKVFCMQCKILIKLYFSDKFDNIRYNVKYQLSFVF